MGNVLQPWMMYGCTIYVYKSTDRETALRCFRSDTFQCQEMRGGSVRFTWRVRSRFVGGFVNDGRHTHTAGGMVRSLVTVSWRYLIV